MILQRCPYLQSASKFIRLRVQSQYVRLTQAFTVDFNRSLRLRNLYLWQKIPLNHHLGE